MRERLILFAARHLNITVQWSEWL